LVRPSLRGLLLMNVGTKPKLTSAKGHFRPIQRGSPMSDHAPEAGIGTAGIYEHMP
jgi:hypothetical protein